MEERYDEDEGRTGAPDDSEFAPPPFPKAKNRETEAAILARESAEQFQRATVQAARAIEQTRADRDLAASKALRALRALRENLDETIDEIEAALDGAPVRSDDFTPNRQYLSEVVEYGSEFRALWFALGYAEGPDAR